MAPPKDELRFASPPVQQVTLSIFFKPEPSIRTTHLFSIIGQWVEQYPKLEEMPPERPWRAIEEQEVLTLTESSLSTWPTPMFVLHSEDGQQSIQVQQDRLEHVWRFEATGSPKEYVGYNTLRAEIQERFVEFRDKMSAVAGVSVKAERADATYYNLLDMEARDFCVGILSNWSVSEATTGYPSAYSGLRLVNFKEAGERTETLVSVEPGPDGVGTDYMIDVQCGIADGEDYLARLDDAHETVIDLFYQLSSSDLRSTWGEK